ncbi:hypothetical protein Tco_0871552 [Tanacetum coccineum]
MVRFEALYEDQLTAKMSVLHCMMMSHGGELLDRYRGLLQSHNEYVQSTDSRLKGFQEKFASLSGLESQVSGLQRQVAGLNDKISSFDAAFSKSKAKGKERKKKIKSITKSLDQLNAEVMNWIFEHAAEPLYIILQLKPEKLARLANVPASRDARDSPPISKESTGTPASESLELPANVVPTSSAVASEENAEWGISHVLDDVAEVTANGSKRVFSSRTDVVVALSIGEKGDGSLLSYVTGEEAAANPSRI